MDVIDGITESDRALARYLRRYAFLAGEKYTWLKLDQEHFRLQVEGVCNRQQVRQS